MSGIPVVEKFKKLICWMLPKISKFPKDQRFLLADRIVLLMFDILEKLLEAVYTKKEQKQKVLNEINLKVEKLRYFVRISYDVKYVNLKSYDYFSSQILEAGKMIGGWRRSLN